MLFTKVENRTCLICNSKEFEDEYHFVSICKEYDSFRQSLYKNINEKSDIFRNLDNKEKFIYKYIYETWSILIGL